MRAWGWPILVGTTVLLCAVPALCRWDTYTKVDGLLDSDVLSMLEDRSGNLWFGGVSGLSRYDGVNWVTYRDPSSTWPPLFQEARPILQDRSCDLWFGGFSGVRRYDGANWRMYTAADGLVNGDVYSGAEDRAGNLWFGGFGGVSRYDGVSWRKYTTADGLASNNVTAVAEEIGRAHV